MNSTPDPQTTADRSHRTVLAVAVTSRPDGGHYIDQADFTAHVAQWLKTDLKGHHAIDQVTVDDQAAELARAQAEAHQYRTALQGVARKAAVPVAVPPADRAGLRKLIAETLMAWAERNNSPQYARARRSETVTANAYSRADAVLSVLPADSEPHRLALSATLGLGTGAPWDAIRERAAELAGLPGPVDWADGADRRVYAWAQTVDTDDGDIRIPGVHSSGTGVEEAAIVVHREDIPVLAGMLAEAGDGPVDRATAFADVRPQTLTAIASHLDARAVAILRPDSETYAEWQTVIAELRRLAAETPSDCPGYETSPNRCICPCEGCRHNCAAHQAAETPGPETQARRGDEFEQWLKAQRDEYEVRSSPQWAALDEALDTYRLHADTGTPLGEHVCEGRVAGDCECLETPAFEADRDSKTSPKVDSKAEPVHARPGPDDNGISPCCGRPPFEFRGERLTRDPAAVTCRTAPAVVAEPGKEA